MNEKWTSHVEWAIMIVTLIGGFYMVNAKIERQGERTDRLYEMFIDLLKEGRK